MPLGLLRKLRLLPQPETIIPEPPLAEISALIAQGDFAAAEQLCVAALRHDPRNIDLVCLLASVAQATAQYGWALVLCKPVLEADAGHVKASLISGQCAAALGQHREAADHLAVVYAASPANPAVTRSYALALLHAGDMDALPEVLSAAPDLYFLSLSSTVAWATRRNIQVLQPFPQETITVSSPPVLGPQGWQAAGAPRDVPGNQPFVVELPDATIFSRSSVIVTSDGVALSELATHPDHGHLLHLTPDPLVVKRREDSVLIDRSGFEVGELEAGVCLNGYLSNAFGHFVPEYLPKIQFLEQHPAYSGLPIIVDEAMPQSHYDYLRCLTDNPLLPLKAGTALRCKRLLVAPTPTFHPYEILSGDAQYYNCASPRSVRFLRERVLAKIEGKSRFGNRVYLSRRNMQWRLLENEAEITAWLENDGFQTVYTEELDFADQVRLFRQADCVVAPNGSALSNLMFADPKVKVIVLSQPNTFNWSGFYGPMHSLGYDPLFVVGDEAADFKHSNYSVPLERLQAALKWDRP